MPGVRFIPPQGIQKTNLIPSDTRHNHFIPSQGYLSGGGLVVLDSMGYEPAGWLNAEFQQRIPLTINAGQVPSTQTDFPLLINDTYPELMGEVEAELRFAGSDNIQLEYEIEKFDSITGELVVWIKKDTVSDGDIIYIYFARGRCSPDHLP